MLSPSIILLLLAISCAAGYLVLRFFGRPLSLDAKIAALPVSGAVLTVLMLQWTHVFVPLSRPAALLFGLAPAAAGFVCFLRDRPTPRSTRALCLVLAITALALLIPLLPFLKIGYPTSFGIHNNDSIYYVASDQLIDGATYGVDAPTSILMQASAGIRRYGINYLSAPVRAITGLRSWETIHIAGGFGLVLAMCTSYLLATALGANRAAAVLAAIATGAGHWLYRLYLDSYLAYLFGITFIMGILWTFLVDWDLRSRLAWSALMIAGLSIFYFDLLPIAIVLSTALVSLRWLTDRRSPYGLAAFGISALLTLPVMRNAVRHFFVLTDSSSPGAHFRWQEPWRSLLHITGTLDVYDYLFSQAPTNLLHAAGAISAIALLAWMLVKLPSNRRVLLFSVSVLLPLLALLLYLLSQGLPRQYHAHRVLVTLSALLLPVLASAASREWKSDRKPVRIAIAALGGILFVSSLQPLYSLNSRLPEGGIVVSPLEKQIGDEWLPRLPEHAVVLIDLAPNTPVFYPHFLYYEAAHALRDERRLRLPGTAYSYLPAPADFRNVDLTGVTHILRRRMQDSHVEGAFLPVASNERYELLELPPGGVLHHPVDNFYGLELSPGIWARWMKQDGTTRICTPRATRVVAKGVAVVNPAIKTLTLTVSVNGTVAGSMQASGPIEMPLSLIAGCSTILWHSSEEPRKPGFNDDQREFTVQFQNLVFEAQTK